MLAAADFEFRKGLGLTLLGIAFLLGANFFGLLAIATAPYGATNSVIGAALALVGGILALVGATTIASRPAVAP